MPNDPIKKLVVDPPLHHIGNDGKDLHIYHSGKMLTVKVLCPHSRIPPPGKKGTVMYFSKQSRLNMLKHLARIDWDKCTKNLFITLTYNDDVMIKTRKQLSNHLWLWIRDIEKHLGRHVYGFWRMEWKLRQSGKHKGCYYPHYHLMILNLPFLAKDVVNASWRKALGQDKYVRTEVKAMANERQAGAYVAKYCAKPDEDLSLVNAAYLYRPAGREWGMIRKKEIPFHAEQETRIASGVLEQAIRDSAGMLLPHVKKHRCSFTVLGQLAYDIAQWVFGGKPLDDMDKTQ